MEHIISASLILIWSSTKYILGISVALYSSLGPLPSYLINIGGGLIGIVAFTYFGTIAKNYIISKLPENRKRKFSSKNRMLVRLRSSLGLPGIAIVSPVLLSIPLGIVLSLSLTSNKRMIMASMLASCIFWSSVIILPFYFFEIDLKNLITAIF